MQPPTCFILMLLLLRAVDGYFDCRRQGMSCVAGGCNLVDGNCACPIGINGTDCGLNISEINATACDPSCEHGGTCLAQTTGNQCYCPEVYTGKTCEKRRAMVECTGANMTITVYPYTGFHGLVYVHEQQQDATCDFDTLQDSDGANFFEKTFDLETGCGAIVKNNTPKADDRTFEREIIIQYNPNMQTALDQFLNISCVHKAKELTTLSSNVENLLIENRGNLSRDNTSSEYTPVALEIQNIDGTPVHGAVYVGRPLRLYFFLTDLAVYDNLRVEDCVAKNGLAGSEMKNETLVKDSCRQPRANQILRGEMEQDAKKGVIIKFDVFKFVDTNIIEFECKVRVCKSTDTRCDPKTCNGELNGLGRRKRETPSGKKDHVVVKDSLYVTDVMRSSSTQSVSPPRAHECLQISEILSVIIILSSAVIILMCATCCLTLVLVRRKTHQKTKSSASTSQMDVSSTSTSGSSGHMRLPRIRVWY
ncbi:EGF-like domain-containing protein 2 [Gigantopelta aegis]|uniref:EGF-like domain-containing protein 2 n=1 Tax=Gigantopelta aegis TaxID=1735272 RepID=UPI001B88C9C7|nr:EGF-like domain-containing protein 2 [Gigantopelta aegis]